jgi:hypothetical protein
VTLEAVADAVAAGVLSTDSIFRAAVRGMRCRDHGAPVVGFGQRGAMCERCAEEQLGKVRGAEAAGAGAPPAASPSA